MTRYCEVPTQDQQPTPELERRSLEDLFLPVVQYVRFARVPCDVCGRAVMGNCYVELPPWKKKVVVTVYASWHEGPGVYDHKPIVSITP